MMEVRLVVSNANSSARQIRLGPRTLIGRSAECNLRIASGQVSRRHCLIKVGDSGVLIRDLGSSNGTQLNGERVPAKVNVTVAPGSTVVVGPLKFVVQFAAAPSGETGETTSLASPPDSLDTSVPSALRPAADDSDETIDLPASQWRSRGARRQDAARAAEPGETPDPGARPDGVADSRADSGIIDFASILGDSVIIHEVKSEPKPPAPAGSANVREESPVNIVFETGDPQPVAPNAAAPSAPPATSPQSPSHSDGFDEDLLKFLSGS